MKLISRILFLLLLVACGIFLWQNASTRVELSILGQVREPKALSWVLLTLYGIGFGLGLLMVAGWSFQDALTRRRFMRELNGPSSATPFEPQPTQPTEPPQSSQSSNYEPSPDDNPFTNQENPFSSPSTSVQEDGTYRQAYGDSTYRESIARSEDDEENIPVIRPDIVDDDEEADWR